MARGRFISNAITSDKKINDLSDDTSRLAFTWLVTYADCEGRTHGDPAMVRSLLFPRRSDVTNERMEAYISEWQAAGLVRVYSANGDLWIDFPNFSKHQTGLRKDHEAASTIPPLESGITTELLRSKDVVGTPQIKRIEDKVSKALASDDAVTQHNNHRSERQQASATLENHFSKLSGLPLPERNTDKQKKAAALRWWNPLLEVWDICKHDTDKAASIIGKAYQQMSADNLTISAPASVVEVCKSLYAKNGHATKEISWLE
jgi:hypothetical protein